ncbi:hypothetical protein [Massilia varians]|uniref:hypothetical protein n=1 Tax=Massilia varians TaxID=457921 RepID=UPI0025569B97|nr:hypothetical protein [Massilia varians]MDK6078653.1 hypothetical protein [Massilia varians]
MRKARAWFALVSVFCMLAVQQQTYAQAALAPVENYVVNRAVGGIIANRIAMARGIAANDAAWMATATNDATYKATMAGVGKVMNGANVASTALGIGLTIAGAPVWLTVAAGLGVIAAGSLIAYNYSNGAEMRVVNTASGNKIQVQSPRPAMPSYSTPVVPDIPKGLQQAIAAGGQAYRDASACYPGNFCYQYPPLPANLPMSVGTDYGVVLGAPDIITLSKVFVFAKYGDMNGPDNLGMGTTFSIEATGGGFVYADDGTPQWYVWIREQRYGCAEPQCDPVNGLPNYDRTYFQYPQYGQKFAPGTYAKQYTSLEQAASAISMDTGTKSVKVSQQLLADTANRAWQQAAAQPGYAGEPYPVAQPLTTLDVARWTSANPTSDPTIDDLLRPATNPVTYPEGVPISPTIVYVAPTPTNPTTSGNVNVVNTPNVNVVNNVKVDFGPDPGISTPGLEAPPTGTEILQPLTSLFPEFRSFQAPQHVGECPKPTFDVFGKSIVMDAQCAIAEQHRASLAAVMMAVWLLVGLFILLSA